VQVNNLTKKAANLKIMMTGGTATVTSYNAFFGVIYAPNTDVFLEGNAEYFGTIVGKTLTITGTAAGHYDESIELAEMGMPRRTALVITSPPPSRERIPWMPTPSRRCARSATSATDSVRASTALQLSSRSDAPVPGATL
jgi:hypothetical protein